MNPFRRALSFSIAVLASTLVGVLPGCGLLIGVGGEQLGDGGIEGGSRDSSVYTSMDSSSADVGVDSSGPVTDSGGEEDSFTADVGADSGGPVTDAADDAALGCDDGGTPLGATRCSGSSTVLSCSTGGTWTAQSCTTSEICVSGACVSPPSCSAGGTTATCGADGGESCCASLPIPGGTFAREYDGINPYYQDPSHTAIISPFRLDKYEVTVARFRQFVDAVTQTTPPWTPGVGAGKHVHINGGNGLASFPSTSQYEYGWDAIWNTATDYILFNGANWAASLTGTYCPTDLQSWTPDPGPNEMLPMNCVTWHEAYAFCIWDGGFLPSDAESNFASAGGAEQRQYPWSSPPASGTIGPANARFCPASAGGACTFLPVNVGSFPAGDGRWGQADLAGNVDEWVLDQAPALWSLGPIGQDLPTSCQDCALLPEPGQEATFRVDRGGSFWDGEDKQLASFVETNHAAARFNNYGIRCARTP